MEIISSTANLGALSKAASAAQTLRRTRVATMGELAMVVVKGPIAEFYALRSAQPAGHGWSGFESFTDVLIRPLTRWTAQSVWQGRARQDRSTQRSYVRDVSVRGQSRRERSRLGHFVDCRPALREPFFGERRTTRTHSVPLSGLEIRQMGREAMVALGD